MRLYTPKKMPSELDPLLPRNDPAPEIQGEGFSKRGQHNQDVTVDYGESQWNYHNTDEEERPQSEANTTRSAISSFIGIFTFVVFAAFVLTLWESDEPIWRPKPIPTPSRTIEQRVSKILSDTPLFDGHNDLAIFIRARYQNHIHSPSFLSKFRNGTMEANVDLPRLRKGQVGGAFWSAFVPCPVNASTDFTDATYATAVSQTLSQIDLIRRLQHQYPETFTPATANLSTAVAAFKADKRLISPISIEGLHQLPPTAPLSTLRLYSALGVRSTTLTWNCHNAFFDAALLTDMSTGATIPSPLEGQRPTGLSSRAKPVIEELNRLGILIDLSHTSHRTQHTILSTNMSRAPVIYSHSSAYAICPHPRNVPDALLEWVKRTGSLVMVNFSPDFVSCVAANSSAKSSSSTDDTDTAEPSPHAAEPGTTLPEFYPANNTLSQVARHIMHIGSLIGYAHVGLGSDFDGMGQLTPRGLEGVDKFPDLVGELLRMGVGDEEVKGVVGGNLVRVWEKVEEVRESMAKEGEGEDEVGRIW